MNFTNVASFKVMCNRLYDGLVEGRGCPYRAFLHVSPSMFEAIDRLRRNCIVPRMSIMYDKNEEILITKFMPRVSLEVLGRLFEKKLMEMCGLGFSSLMNTGSVRFGDVTRRCKEPDISFMPKPQDLTTDWPSLVVEVAVSESLIDLQGDLLYWLRESLGRTRVAILLHIDMVGGTILVECWKVLPRERPDLDYAATVQMAQRILLDAQVVYGGPSLFIPAEQLFDDVPANVDPRDFNLSARDLDNFNDEFWNLLNRAPRRY